MSVCLKRRKLQDKNAHAHTCMLFNATHKNGFVRFRGSLAVVRPTPVARKSGTAKAAAKAAVGPDRIPWQDQESCYY